MHEPKAHVDLDLDKQNRTQSHTKKTVEWAQKSVRCSESSTRMNVLRIHMAEIWLWLTMEKNHGKKPRENAETSLTSHCWNNYYIMIKVSDQPLLKLIILSDREDVWHLSPFLLSSIVDTFDFKISDFFAVFVTCSWCPEMAKTPKHVFFFFFSPGCC